MYETTDSQETVYEYVSKIDVTIELGECPDTSDTQTQYEDMSRGNAVATSQDSVESKQCSTCADTSDTQTQYEDMSSGKAVATSEDSVESEECSTYALVGFAEEKECSTYALIGFAEEEECSTYADISDFQTQYEDMSRGKAVATSQDSVESEECSTYTLVELNQ